MFANGRVVLPGLQLFRVEFLVLRDGVVVSRAGARHMFDFFSVALGHLLMLRRLKALSPCTQIGKDFLDAMLVNDAHALV